MGVSVVKFLRIIAGDRQSPENISKACDQLMFTLVDRNQNQISPWFSFLRRVLKQWKYNIPIVIFIASGCQLIQYDSKIQTQKKVYEMVFSGQLPAHYPIFVIWNQFTDNAHVFLTYLKNVKDFINNKANVKLRRTKDQMCKPQCFQFYPLKLPPPAQLNTQQINKCVMQSIWTLDIQTYNQKNQQMKPYCIRVYDGSDDVWSCMAEPQQVCLQFRQTFLTMLKQTRNEQSKQLIIFAHNGSRFDWVILFREVIKVFPDVRYFGRLTQLKYLIIPSINVKLADFFLIVSDSLAKIADQFKTEHRKSKCQQILQLKSLNQLSHKQKQNIWNYCLNDCIVLWECIN